MHPDSNRSHLKRAHRLGRGPQPEMEQRDLLGGLGSIIGGIINGIGNIIHGGHHHGGGGGVTPTHHSPPPPKHNNGGVSHGSPAKAAPPKHAQAKPKPAAPATTKKVITNNNAAANVHTTARNTPAQHATTSEHAAPSPSSSAKTPESRLSSGRSANSGSSSASLTASGTTDQGTTTIEPSSTSMAGTWAPGDSPGVSGVTAANNGGLSKGGIAAVVTVLLLLLLAAVVFFLRRHKKQQRENRAAASPWAASNYPKFEEKNRPPDAVSVEQAPEMVQRPSKAAGDDRSYITAADVGHQNYSTPSFPAGLVAHTGHSPIVSPIAPSFAAENRQRSAFSEFGRSPPTSPGASSPLTPLTGMPYDMAALPRTPTTARSDSYEGLTNSNSGSGHSSSQLTAMEALVSQVFVPTLDDELKVSTGERIRVLHEYDDGWALCQNASGQEGMVPIECIQKLSTVPTGLQASWRNSQRISSLSGH